MWKQSIYFTCYSTLCFISLNSSRFWNCSELLIGFGYRDDWLNTIVCLHRHELWRCGLHRVGLPVATIHTAWTVLPRLCRWANYLYIKYHLHTDIITDKLLSVVYAFRHILDLIYQYIIIYLWTVELPGKNYSTGAYTDIALHLQQSNITTWRTQISEFGNTEKYTISGIFLLYKTQLCLQHCS